MEGPMLSDVVGRDLVEDASMSSMSSVATLFQAIVGAGTLSLPYAFKQAGAAGACILCMLVCACEGFTLYVLSKFAERYDRLSYAQLVRANVGRKISTALPFLLVIYSFGSCTAYMMITADAFCDLISPLIGEDHFLVQRWVMILMAAYVVLFPTCLARTLGALVVVSSSAFIAFGYTAVVVVLQGIEGYRSREPYPLNGFHWFKWDLSILYAVPIIVFGFNSHTNIIAIFKELKDQPDPILRVGSSTKRTVKMENMIEVIVFGLSLILAGYMVLGFAGYMGYLDVSSNILNDMPVTPMVQGVRFAMALVVLFTYPITFFPAREGFEDAMAMIGHGEAARSTFFFVAFTFAFISGTAALSMAVTDLGMVLSLVGGTVASFLIFFVPGLMLINESLRKHSKRLLSQHASLSLLDEEQRPDYCESQEEALVPNPSGTTSSVSDLSAPLLDRLFLVADKGIKKSGLMYSPGKSWAAGVFLVSLSVSIMTITVYTTVATKP